MRCCFAASRIWEEKGEENEEEKKRPEEEERPGEEEDSPRRRGWTGSLPRAVRPRCDGVRPAQLGLGEPLVFLVHDALDDIERDRHRAAAHEPDREPVVVDDFIARDPQVPPVLEDDERGGRGGDASIKTKSPLHAGSRLSRRQRWL